MVTIGLMLDIIFISFVFYLYFKHVKLTFTPTKSTSSSRLPNCNILNVPHSRDPSISSVE